ncbi:MAG: hypothetical protein AABY11_02330, partial [archaeon]
MAEAIENAPKLKGYLVGQINFRISPNKTTAALEYPQEILLPKGLGIANLLNLRAVRELERVAPHVSHVTVPGLTFPNRAPTIKEAIHFFQMKIHRGVHHYNRTKTGSRIKTGIKI